MIDAKSGAPVAFDAKGISPDLGGTLNGARTVFQHMAERYLNPEHAPEQVAERIGISAARIR